MKTYNCVYLFQSGEIDSAGGVGILRFHPDVRLEGCDDPLAAAVRGLLYCTVLYCTVLYCRYVDYYATMISDTLQYNPVKMYLTSIVIDPLPQLGRGQQEGFIQVSNFILFPRHKTYSN